MSALPEAEAKEFFALVARVGEAVVAAHIAPKTSISQLSPVERQALKQWMREQIDGPGDGQQAT